MRVSLASQDFTSQMVTLGATAPAGFIPFSPSEATISPLNGKKIGFWGDSIMALYGSYWMPTILARTSCINGFQDARAGRDFGHAFENYSGGVSTGTNLGAAAPYPNTGTLGNTLAQDLAGLSGMICELGTNDLWGSPTDYALGSPGDATTAGTCYGYIRAFIEGVLTANPTMRLVMIAPYNSSARGAAAGSTTITTGVVTAIQTVAANYGVPVLDAYHLGGINQFNWATYLQADGLHINAAGGAAVFGPAIAEFAQRWF